MDYRPNGAAITETDASTSGVPGALADPLGDAVVVCFSHLRWDWVWQRPQHIFSRLAQEVPVYLVEEPLPSQPGFSGLTVVERGGVTVLTPHLAEPPAGFGDQSNPAIRALLGQFLAERLAPEIRVILWYYTPMALAAEPADMQPALVVYDAMDDLASFRGAPAAMREREAAIFAWADLVFAGGPSLYATRQGRHPRVHCLPSGVEPAHFAQAANGIVRPPDLTALPRPILGYYGVLDERLDLDLLAAVADARPDWTLALVGPVAKIAADDLPRRPNIVYYGPRPYAELPAYLAAFEVAMLPFARNEATRSISPTKTLEYLAGDKPVVSTPIRDVIDLYGEAVLVAATSAQFVDAVERLLDEPPERRARRLAVGRRLVAAGDWDAIVGRMRSLIAEALVGAADEQSTRSLALRR